MEPRKLTIFDKILVKTICRFIPYSVKPNHVTVFRFLATPFVAFLMYDHHYSIGLVAFLLVALTDAIDGALARSRDQITNWGKVYDPLADKILIGSMVFIIVLRYIDLWTALAIMFIEFLLILTGWLRMRKGRVIEANFWGKIKMCSQVLGVAILLLSIIFNVASLLPFASGALYLAIAFAIVSLFTYGV